MKAALKYIVANTYKPLLERYLAKVRVYDYEDIRLEIPPQVFHPGFFFSTGFLLSYIKKMPLPGKQLLELGCGSGLISIYASRKGALVTASDINSIAIEYLEKNSARNHAKLRIIKSDLFGDISPVAFDIIAINPPYYKKQPIQLKDYAWFCGENGEYFLTLFQQLRNYVHDSTEVVMVLCDGCDLEMISELSEKNGYTMQCVLVRQNLLEKNFLFRIVKMK